MKTNIQFGSYLVQFLERKCLRQNLQRKSKHVLCSIIFFIMLFIRQCGGKKWQSWTGHVWPWHINTSCWIPKATNTHSEYVIFIAFPLLQWLHKCTSMLRYTCTAWFVLIVFIHCSSDNALVRINFLLALCGHILAGSDILACYLALLPTPIQCTTQC
jgi:hypothetical protein